MARYRRSDGDRNYGSLNFYQSNSIDINNPNLGINNNMESRTTSSLSNNNHINQNL